MQFIIFYTSYYFQRQSMRRKNTKPINQTMFFNKIYKYFICAKKFLPLYIFFSTLALASDFRGVIQAIDSENKTITINDTVIKVMPYTEIEQDSCGLGWDTYKTFSELKIDDIVEVDVFYEDGKIIAKEIEIECWRAY